MLTGTQRSEVKSVELVQWNCGSIKVSATEEVEDELFGY